MADFSCTPKAMAPIRNPYANNGSSNNTNTSMNSHGSHRSLTSSLSSSSRASSAAQPNYPARCNSSSSSSSSSNSSNSNSRISNNHNNNHNHNAETAVRSWIRSCDQSAGGLPSLASVEALRDQLLPSRPITWSDELALGFGRVVQACLRSCCRPSPEHEQKLMDVNNHMDVHNHNHMHNHNHIQNHNHNHNHIQNHNHNHNHNHNKTLPGRTEPTETGHSERVCAAVSELLASCMEDWDDHVLYAVLVQSQSQGSKTSTNTNTNTTGHQTSGREEHLLDTLTRLCLLPENHQVATLERIRFTAVVCLATAWRCLDRLEQHTNLSSDHTGFPWWITQEKTINSLAVASFRSLFRTHGCIDSHDSNFNLNANPSTNTNTYTNTNANNTSGFSDHGDEFGVCEAPHTFASFDVEQEKMSSLTILTILLRYQLLNVSTSSVSNTISTSIAGDGCTLPTSTLTKLISKLISGVQILNHSTLLSSSTEYTLPNAMLSMSILSLLQRSLTSSENDSLFHDLDRTIQYTGLAENLVQFTFSSIYSDGNESQNASWISTASKRFRNGYLQTFGFHLLTCWKFCQGAAWKVVVGKLEPKLKSMIDPFWSNLLRTGNIQHRSQSSEDGNHLERQLTALVWLHSNLHGHVRYRLHCVLEQTLEQPRRGSNPFNNDYDTEKALALRKIVHSLFAMLRLSSGASCTARFMTSRLIRTLLVDRRIVSSNDELSRSIWNAVDDTVVEDHLERVLEHADTEDANQPLLVTLVDTMETLLEHEDIQNYLVEKLDAHNLETLIYLIKPKDVRYDFALGIDDEVAGSNTETPPLHNLSRLDETSICIEHEETKEPRGLDHSVRLSVATSLARLAYGSSAAPPNESIGLLISRISSAVNDFLLEYHNLIEGGGNPVDKTNTTTTTTAPTPSMDQTKRFMRLQHACAIPENEEFLSSMMFTGISHRNKKISQLVDARNENDHDLRVAKQQANEAQEEKVRLIQRISVQSVLFERELNRTKLNAMQEARQAVSMHASERSSAEERSKRLKIQVEEEKVEFERAKTEAQNAKQELETTKSKVEELNGTIGALQQELNDEKAKSNEIAQKIEANRDAIVLYEEKCGDMQNFIDEKEETISRMGDTNHRLQSDLEDLFADMCSLAQIYQHKETQDESQKQLNTKAIDAVNEKLEVERRRNEELSAKMKAMQEENDKLYRKLAKYKERLEQECNAKREDQKRRKEEEQRKKRSGPVSYLNSLHSSSSSDKSQSRSKHTRSLRDVSSSSHTRSLRDVSSTHTRKLRDVASTHTRSLRDVASSHTRSLRDVASSHTRTLRDVASSHTRTLRDVSTSQRSPPERPIADNKSRDRSTQDKENIINRPSGTHGRSVRSQRKVDC